MVSWTTRKVMKESRAETSAARSLLQNGNSIERNTKGDLEDNVEK